MLSSIYLVEGAIYVGLGLLLGLLSGEPGGALWAALFSLFFYIGYLFLNRVWNYMMSGFGKIVSIIFTSGAILVLLIPGDLIRRLAFGVYTGDAPVEVAFGDPLEK